MPLGPGSPWCSGVVLTVLPGAVQEVPLWRALGLSQGDENMMEGHSLQWVVVKVGAAQEQQNLGFRVGDWRDLWAGRCEWALVGGMPWQRVWWGQDKCVLGAGV